MFEAVKTIVWSLRVWKSMVSAIFWTLEEPFKVENGAIWFCTSLFERRKTLRAFVELFDYLLSPSDLFSKNDGNQ